MMRDFDKITSNDLVSLVATGNVDAVAFMRKKMAAIDKFHDAIREEASDAIKGGYWDDCLVADDAVYVFDTVAGFFDLEIPESQEELDAIQNG